MDPTFGFGTVEKLKYVALLGIEPGRLARSPSLQRITHTAAHLVDQLLSSTLTSEGYKLWSSLLRDFLYFPPHRLLIRPKFPSELRSQPTDHWFLH